MNSKIMDDERGIAHLLYIVLIVIVVGAIGFTGYRVLAKNKTSDTSKSGSTNTATTSSSSTGVSASCLASYHDANLCHFAEFSTDFQKTAYTANLTVTQNGTTNTMTLENDGKGNTQLASSGNGSTINAITLGGKTYIQDNGSGPWIEYSTGTTAPVSNPTSSMDVAVGGSGITFKSDGKASCGSLTCYKYQVTDAASPGATQYVLFDTSSYKLREWLYSDSGNSTDMTVSYGSVNITTPSPVESLNSSL